jgi:hypothetical protein
MLRNVGRGQIKLDGRTCFKGLKTESQGFVADTCCFLYGDLIGSPEQRDWRIYRDHDGLCATHLKREIKFSATVRQSAISKVANSRFMAVHEAPSPEAIDASGKAFCLAGRLSAGGMQK